MVKLGIIGGSGLYHLPEVAAAESVPVQTPFGSPSAAPRIGRVAETEIVFLARHGAGHIHSPTTLPYRANVYALKALGVSHLLSVSAVGSLREALPPRSVVLPDQIIDRTVARERTFFDDGVVAHVGLADPFCPNLRRSVATVAPALGSAPRDGGTYLCIEGPQFSTRAESHLYRSWGATVIGMTAMPEARLAREAELCYATIALVTDYDVWHEEETEVSVELVLGHLRANVTVAADLIRAVAEQGLPARDCGCKDALRDAVMTAPERITDAQRRRLGVIGAARVAAADRA